LIAIQWLVPTRLDSREWLLTDAGHSHFTENLLKLVRPKGHRVAGRLTAFATRPSDSGPRVLPNGDGMPVSHQGILNFAATKHAREFVLQASSAASWLECFPSLG